MRGCIDIVDTVDRRRGIETHYSGSTLGAGKYMCIQGPRYTNSIFHHENTFLSVPHILPDR